jgi:3'-phosphoadenosine 5'-phosphosulfate sulfotransferase (PAPS reductase)/FAD synthetase
MNNVVSLSGGKDSTAMLHMMLDRGESIHSMLFFDTGWEFPEMYAHLDLIEQKTGLSITRIKPKKSFDHWMYRQRVRAKEGVMKGQVVRIGNGWPHTSRRWCTREKVQAMAKYERKVPDLVKCVGYASDELHRYKPGLRYPLIEYGMTEADCLKYCKGLGYNWGGLYNIFQRVSCWCCPLQSLPNLRKLRKHRPELWDQLIEMDLRQPRGSQGFQGTKSVIDIETRFRQEETRLGQGYKQLGLFTQPANTSEFRAGMAV